MTTRVQQPPATTPRAPAPGPRPRGASPRRREARRRLRPYYYIAPALLFLTVLMAFPLFEGIRLSFTDTNMLNPSGGEYVGTDNYSELAGSSKFLGTLKTTVIYTFFCVAGAVGVGLLAALGMNLMVGKFARRLRGIIIIPWAAPIIPVALVAAWMLDNQLGVVNWALESVGAIDGHVYWLGNEKTALPAIILVTVWRIFPFSAIVLLAALQGVSKELYEAAQIDGASWWQVQRKITIPLLGPTIRTWAFLSMIGSLQLFDMVWILTGGGPANATTTMATFLVTEGTKRQNFGIASAASVILFVVALVLALLYQRVILRRDTVDAPIRKKVRR